MELKKIIEEELKKLVFFKSISDIGEELGVSVYVVGGFVRDLILGRERDDIDFLIVGDCEIFAEAVSKRLGINRITVYKNFGTAHFDFSGYNLEFVGARRESYNSSSRKPIVTNGTFEDDITRRDFTINAIAISLNKNNLGEVVDIFGGIKDIESRLLKTPLNPLETFDDDPLRIMRAFRFSAQLNFNLDESIMIAAEKMKERLRIVSQERITDEFIKILKSPKPSVALIQMFYSNILEEVFPEISSLYGVDQKKEHHHKDVFFHTMQVVDNISSFTDNVWLRFTALVHDIAKPMTKRYDEEAGWSFHGHEEMGARIMEKIFKRLKLPLTNLSYVEKLVRLHLRPIALAKEEVTDSAIRRLIVEAGEDLNDLITLCRADITSKNPVKVASYLNNFEIVMARVLEVREKDKLRAFQSPVSGEIIMEVCGLKPSKTVGLIKKEIEEAILEGKIANDYDEALSFLMEIKDNYLSPHQNT